MPHECTYKDGDEWEGGKKVDCTRPTRNFIYYCETNIKLRYHFVMKVLVGRRARFFLREKSKEIVYS